MGKILGRYILREVMAAWLLVTGVLLIILLAYQVVGVLERAAANQFPPGVVLELIWLGALQYLTILLPVGMLLGVVLAFGRLYADSEMAAALACGAGPGIVYLPVLLLALLAAAALAWMTLVLAPRATEQALSLRAQAVRAGQFAPIAAGKFRSFSGGSAVARRLRACSVARGASSRVIHASAPATKSANSTTGRYTMPGPAPQASAAAISLSAYSRPKASTTPSSSPTGSRMVRYCSAPSQISSSTTPGGNWLAAARSSTPTTW